MPYHRSKKVLFLQYLSFETKKSFLVGGWLAESDFKKRNCELLQKYVFLITHSLVQGSKKTPKKQSVKSFKDHPNIAK